MGICAEVLFPIRSLIAEESKEWLSDTEDAIPKLFRTTWKDSSFEMGVAARAYYRNDQRIQWSGGETTFGTEGALTPSFQFLSCGAVTRLNGEFYFNQPYEKNIYLSSQERRSYAANYAKDTFEISQLFISWEKGDFELRAGKFETPFGRCLVPMMSNSKVDAPFIRAESIDWRQTGFLVRWTPSVWEADAGIVNGCENLDTNSMKAVIGRIGQDYQYFRWGFSGLYQDGIGSEEHKQYKNHFGFDAAVRFGNLTLSAEGIYDEYGFRRNFNPEEIFWERSLYYRQINKGYYLPTTGLGYYVNLNYRCGQWIFDFNYGEYHPEKLQNPQYPQHDIINRRFLLKAGWNIQQHLQLYTALLLENDGYIAQAAKPHRGTCLLVGMKLRL
ncbi:MAG: hypothetical protein LBJ67_04445 [Planctomycetaceae bacterium]|nr:hypothetical protein [Planctomycetaceae bacterium]